MIFFEIKDKKANTVMISNLDGFPERNIFNGFENSSMTVGDYRQSVKENDAYVIRLIGKKDSDFFCTPKITKRSTILLESLAPFFLKFKRDQEEGYKIFSHNLITTHAMLQDEIESILPAESFIRAKNYQDQKTIASNLINDADDIADTLLQLNKRIVDLQAQIEGFKILTNEVVPNFAFHNIKKVLLNILYPYFELFSLKSIFIDIDIDELEAQQKSVYIDYKLFNVSMHHFFNNALKYSKQGESIKVNFDFETNTLYILMTSVRINKEETEKIFKLHEKGIHSGDLAGEGIGMYMVGRSLELLRTRMDIYCDYATQEMIDFKPYVKNKFQVRFNTIG